MQLAGQWAWRFLVVAAAITVCVYVVAALSEIVIPVLVALLVCALVAPPMQFFQRLRWPKWLALAVSLIGVLVIVGGLALLLTVQIRSGCGFTRWRSCSPLPAAPSSPAFPGRSSLSQPLR
ncbi:hypothetical protein D7I44_16605 [Gryllotalpicola protaetiae]|uniref:AI-2E family transporter n=1 Tax=Gryllotalpicola protaetiae TaxID=2419771 RepID=A0A387BV44_9MICO|nr:hypothetical protein D7I44_16605 [Gryllotalpicola protaetiae]